MQTASSQSKPLAAAALIIAAVMLMMWFGIGSDGIAPLPIEGVSKAAQVQETSPPIEVLPGELPSFEADSVPRVRVNEPNSQKDDLSGTALLGTVFDPVGKPVKGAVVALLVPGPNGPDKELMAHVKTDANGNFVLEPPSEMLGRDLALIARRVGYRPACLRFRITPKEQQHDLALVLERGHAIEGRVFNQGRPVANASVQVDLRWLVSGVHGIGTEAFWIDGRLEEKSARTMTDASGHFHLSGLGPHEHYLKVDGGFSRLKIGYEAQVRAPRHGLHIDVTSNAIETEIDWDLAQIEIWVRQSGYGLSGAWILASYGGQQLEAQSKAGEPTVFAVPAGEEVRLIIHDDWSEFLEKTVTAPDKGSRLRVDIDLVRVERPGMRLDLRGARAQGIRQIEARLHGRGVNSARLLSIAPSGDSFLWIPIPGPSGSYNLTVGPREYTSGQYLLASSMQITLPSSGVITVKMDLKLGGLFELYLTPRDGSGFNGKARLVSGSGVPVWRKQYFGGWNVAFGLGGGSVPQPKAYQHQNAKTIMPGTYRLLVEGEGAKPVEREVEIRAGETTKEYVHL